MAGKLLSEQGKALQPFADAFSNATRSAGDVGRRFFQNLGWSATDGRAERPRRAKSKSKAKRRVVKKK